MPTIALRSSLFALRSSFFLSTQHAALLSSPAKATRKRLPLVDARVRVLDQGAEVVGGAAAREAAAAEVPGHPNLVDGASGDLERLEAGGDERAGLHLAAQGGDDHRI